MSLMRFDSRPDVQEYNCIPCGNVAYALPVLTLAQAQLEYHRSKQQTHLSIRVRG